MRRRISLITTVVGVCAVGLAALLVGMSIGPDRTQTTVRAPTTEPPNSPYSVPERSSATRSLPAQHPRATPSPSPPTANGTQGDPREAALREQIRAADAAARQHIRRRDDLLRDLNDHRWQSGLGRLPYEQLVEELYNVRAIGAAGNDLYDYRGWLPALNEEELAQTCIDRRNQLRFQLAEHLLNQNRRNEAVQEFRLVHNSEGGTTQLGEAARARLAQLGAW